MSGEGEAATKERFLVCHDYGMGGAWWWVSATSAMEIMERIADVVVVTRPDTLEQATSWDLDEVDIDTPDPNPLSRLRAVRNAQRGVPGFGALVGRGTVYLSRPWVEDDGTVEVVQYLMEIGGDGCRTRQVEVLADGTMIKTTDEDWALNPPFDLYDPGWAQFEVAAREFEQAWARAERPVDQP